MERCLASAFGKAYGAIRLLPDEAERGAARGRPIASTLHLFAGEQVLLKIFRKILDIIRFFQQNPGYEAIEEGERLLCLPVRQDLVQLVLLRNTLD